MAHVSTYRPFAGLRDRWLRFVRNQRSNAELAALTAGDIRAIAQDIGLSEPALRSLRHDNPRDGELMPERMRQLGLDPEFVAHAHAATYRDMAKVCAGCSSWRRCVTDLDRGDVGAGMKGYCANATTMDALLVDRRVAG